MTQNKAREIVSKMAGLDVTQPMMSILFVGEDYSSENVLQVGMSLKRWIGGKFDEPIRSWS